MELGLTVQPMLRILLVPRPLYALLNRWPNNILSYNKYKRTRPTENQSIGQGENVLIVSRFVA